MIPENITSISWSRGYGCNPQVCYWIWNGSYRDRVFTDFPFDPYFFINKGVEIRTPHRQSSTDAITLAKTPVELIEVDTPNVINDIKKEGISPLEVFEWDIPYGKNVAIEKKIRLCSTFRRAWLDIETDPRYQGVSLDQGALNRIISIDIVGEDNKEYWICDDSENNMFKQLDEILSQYNLALYWSNLDKRYLLARAKELGILKYLPYLRTIEGLDLMTIATNANIAGHFPSLFSLAKELGIQFKDYGVKENYAVLWNWFQSSRLQLHDYNYEDVRVLKEIDNYAKLSSAAIELIGHFNIFAGELQYTSHIHDWQALREMRSRNPRIVLPPKIIREEKKYTGAIVVPPAIQGYISNVILIDFQSMYPNIIRSLNISPDTIDENGRFKTPIVNFSDKFDGVARIMLQDYNISLQDATKRLAEATPSEVFQRKAYRWILKRVLNSEYGWFASSKVCRLFNPAIPAATTAMGRWIIEKSIEYASKKGFQIIYGDTDSILIRQKHKDFQKDTYIIDEINEYLKEQSKKEFGVSISSGMVLGYVFKWIYFGEKKKRYIGRIIFDGDKPANYIKVVGYEIRRADWTQLAKRVQWKCIELIESQVKDLDFAIKPFLDVLRIQLFKGELDSEIIYSKGMRQKEYKSKIPQVRAAEIMQKAGYARGLEPIKFNIIGISKVRDSKGHLKKQIDVYPLIPNSPKITQSGYEFTWKGQVLAIIDRFGINYMGDQLSLDDIKMIDLMEWWLHD